VCVCVCVCVYECVCTYTDLHIVVMATNPPDCVLRLNRKEEAAGKTVNVLDAGSEGYIRAWIYDLWIEVPMCVDDQPPDEGEA
jgi:hypothetical protein